MPFEIIRNDITKMHVDAVVNAANTKLEMGGGVCGAIFSAAGAVKLQEACDKIGKCDEGSAVITPAFELDSKYIIHTVGPVWNGGKSNEHKLLADCYTNTLLLAKEYECGSIAIPLISTGVYGYPKELALGIAITAIKEFLKDNDMHIYLVVYDKKSFVTSRKLVASIKKYIDDNYIDEHFISRSKQSISVDMVYNSMLIRSLDDVLDQLEETFSKMLLRSIDEKGMSDVETYKKANIDRKLFSKIRSDINYSPSKSTVLAFAIALELNLDETKDLLARAGYAISHSPKFDIIIEYFINEGIYNIFEINEVLFSFDQSLLGAKVSL